MRSAFFSWGIAMLVAGTAVVVSARDPWFPAGPVQPQIPHGMLLPQKVRAPQFPLKTARTLHSDAEIARARANVTQYPAAQAIAAQVMKEADYWAAWSWSASAPWGIFCTRCLPWRLCGAHFPVRTSVGRSIRSGATCWRAAGWPMS